MSGLAGIAEADEDRSDDELRAVDDSTTIALDSGPYQSNAVENFFTEDDGSSMFGDGQGRNSDLPAISFGSTFSLALSRTFSRYSVDSVAPHLAKKIEQRAERTMPLVDLCDVIDGHKSLVNAEILSVECYREWSNMGILHRTLIFELRRPRRSNIWLRVDRRRARNVSLVGFALNLGRTEANDVACLSSTKAVLLKRPNARPENKLEFASPPNLGTFNSCFRAICAELLEYMLWPLMFIRHRRLYDLSSSLHLRGESIKAALAIRDFLYTHGAPRGKDVDPYRAFEPALLFENAVCQLQYPREALALYESLAFANEPILAPLTIIQLFRVLHKAVHSTCRRDMASHLIHLARAVAVLDPIASRAYLAEARVIATTHSSGKSLWSHPHVLTDHTSNVRSVAYSPDGKRIASCSHDKTIRVWDALTGNSTGEPLRGHADGVRSVAFSPDSQQLVSGSADGTMMRWDVSSGLPVGTPLHHASSRKINCVAVSPVGSLIACGSYYTAIELWDASTGRRLGEPLNGHTTPVRSLAFSPDGKRLVSGSGAIALGSSDELTLLWDVSTGRAIAEPLNLKGHARIVSAVAFSPDGKLVVSGSWDKTLRRWDANTGEPIGGVMKGHTSNVNSVAFTPDGKTIASGSDDSTIRLWDALTGESIGDPLGGHSDPVNSVAFSPDGRQLVSGSYDGTVRIWDSLDLDDWPDAE